MADAETSDPPRLLEFDGPMAIVGGGRVDPETLRELARRGVSLVGADGGGDVIAASGLFPAAIIGDLDSLRDRSLWESRTCIIHLAEQVTTDFHKALYSTKAPVTLAVGMTGGRLDHSLAAFSLILQYAPFRRLIVVDEVDAAMAVVGPVTLDVSPGERVSIHPLRPIEFTRSTGLRYPLDGMVLEPGGAIGTSNEGLGGPLSIVPADGTPWLLILGKERLWDLIAAFDRPPSRCPSN